MLTIKKSIIRYVLLSRDGYLIPTPDGGTIIPSKRQRERVRVVTENEYFLLRLGFRMSDGPVHPKDRRPPAFWRTV